MFYHVIKSYLLSIIAVFLLNVFVLNLGLGSFICSIVFSSLGPSRSLIFMKYMFITKGSALVYINNFACGLRAQEEPQGRSAR